MVITVKIKKLEPDVTLPKFAYPGDVAVDLQSVESVSIGVQKIVGVHTGIAIELPKGFEAQIRPRSGLALKHGISIVNSPGTIDTEYRGEIIIIMVNLGEEPFEIKKGDRIAQMAIREVPVVEFEEVDELSDTTRGASGFGSSGKH